MEQPLGAATIRSQEPKEAGCKEATTRVNQAKCVWLISVAVLVRKSGAVDHRVWSKEESGFGAAKGPSQAGCWCRAKRLQASPNRLQKLGKILYLLKFHLNFGWRNLNVLLCKSL